MSGTNETLPPPDEIEGGTPVEQTPPEENTDPAAVAAEYRRQLDEANHRAEEATRRAEEARRQAAQVQTTAAQAQHDMLAARADSVQNALTAEEARAETLRRDWASAQRDGDFDKAAELQFALGKVAASIQRLEDTKAALEQHRQQALRQPPPPAAPPPPADPIEADLARRDPRVRDFLSKNRHLYRPDGTLRPAVQAAHFDALDQGLSEYSPEYFRHVEARLTPQRSSVLPDRQADTKATPRPPAAAPGRAPADYSGQGRQAASRDYIPPHAVQTAKWLGIDPAEYWRGVQETEKSNGWLEGNPYKSR